MQQTAQYDIEELNDELISTILAPFRGRHVKIVVEDVKEEQPLSQREIYKKVMKAKKAFKDVRVSPDINLSDLANEVNL